jgi:hypothetical protein
MNLKHLVAGAACALAVSSTAHAAIVITTYEGTVWLGQDHAGLFKAPGTDLAGLAYTASFTIDTDVNRYSDVSPQGPVEGANNFGSVMPLLDASFTLDGATIQLDPARFNVFTVGGFRYLLGSNCGCPADPTGDPNLDFTFDAFSANAPASLDAPFSFVPGANTYGYLALYTPEGEYAFDGNFYVDRVTGVVQTAAIPEPATWALMILGFGGAGAMLRRLRAPALAA